MYLKDKNSLQHEFLALDTYLWSVSKKSDAKIYICCSKIRDRRYTVFASDILQSALFRCKLLEMNNWSVFGQNLIFSTYCERWMYSVSIPEVWFKVSKL